LLATVIVDCAKQIESQMIMIEAQQMAYLEEEHGVINEDDVDVTGKEDDKMRVNLVSVIGYRRQRAPVDCPNTGRGCVIVGYMDNPFKHSRT
jgi:hypothetical protein